MTDSKHPTFDALMNQAYDRFKANPSWTKESFWGQLNPAERAAVFLGNMNYQVGNGGWSQWGPMCNNYGTPETYRDIHTYLTQIGTETSLMAREILDNAWALMHDWDDNDSDEYAWDDISNQLSPLCSAYYDIMDQLVDDIEAWLVKSFKVTEG